MNKLISKIVGACLGLSLATCVGVGVAVGQNDFAKVEAAADETVTFSSQGYTNQQSISSYTGTNFSIAFSKGSNSNDPKYYTSGTAIRLYGGNTMTFSSSTKIFVKIELTFGGSDGSNTITTDEPTYSNGAWVGTANQVTFTIGGTTGNRRIAGVAVTYATASTKTLTGLAVSGSFSKTSYGSNEEWDPSGLTVTASYDSGSPANVTSSATWTFNPAHPDSDSITSVVATAHYDEGGVALTANSTAQSVTVTLVKGSVESYPYSVADARAAITANTGVNNVYTRGILVEVTYYNSSYHSLSYKISDDGTDTNVLEIYSGKGLDGANFSSKDDLVVGSTLVIYGNLTLYQSTTYQYSMNSVIKSIVLPSLSSITRIDGTLSAFVGASSWDLSGLTPYGTIGVSNTEVDISSYVTLSTSNVPGNTAGNKTVPVVVTPNDSSLSSLTTTINVSGVVSEQELTATHTYSSSDQLIVDIKDENNVTVATATMDKASGGTAPGWNGTSSEYRLYAKGYLYVRAAVNYELVSVSTIFVANANKSGVKPTAKHYIGDDVATPTCSTATTSNYDYDVEGSELFAIYADGTAGNLGFKSITVGYKKSSTTVNLVSVSTEGSLLKTTQYTGQSLDTHGLTFTAHYDNNTTSEVLASAIEWNTLAVGNQATGVYQEKTVTVTGLTIVDGSNVVETIFTNNISTDRTTAFDDLSSHNHLGSMTFSDGSYAYNGADSTLKLGSTDYAGSITLTCAAQDKYISKVIVLAKYFGTDETVLTVSGSSTSVNQALESTYDLYEFDISADESLSATISTPAKKQRCYIHSVTVLLNEDSASLADAFASDFLEMLSTGTGAVCDANGNTDVGDLQAAWELLAEQYADLSAADKALFSGGNADEDSENVIEQALALYDYIAAKYNTQLQSQTLSDYNFMGRTLSSGARPMVNILNVSDNSAAVTAIIVVMALTMTTAGAYFFLRKKKEN